MSVRINRRGPNGSKFNPARAATITTAVRFGASYQSAAAAAGISPTTLREWLRRGDYLRSCGEEDDPMAQFSRDFEEADSGILRKIEGTIVDAAMSDWRAGAWILKMRMPAQYSEKESKEFAEEIIDALLARILQRCGEGVYQSVVDNALTDSIETTEAK